MELGQPGSVFSRGITTQTRGVADRRRQGMADVLAAVPDQGAVPLKEIGHASAVDAKDLADASEMVLLTPPGEVPPTAIPGRGVGSDTAGV